MVHHGIVDSFIFDDIQVVIESTNIQGQYLHASAHAFGNRHPHKENHEINLNFRNTTFIIYQHLSYKEDLRGMIKGASVIQLFHKVGFSWLIDFYFGFVFFHFIVLCTGTRFIHCG